MKSWFEKLNEIMNNEMMTKETGIIDKCVIALKNNKKEKKNVFLKS